MSFRKRGALSAALVAVALGFAGCDSFLTVQNPAAITDDQLNDPALATTLANAALGELGRTFGGGDESLAYFSAIITDEAVSGHNFIQWKEIDLRQMNDANDLGYYGDIHQARWYADTTAARLKTLVGEADLRTAMTYAVAGYTYVLAGEFLCESPMNNGGEIFTSNEISAMALPRFDEAIRIATAAKAAGRSAADADEIINIANTGKARAALQIGNDALAITAASAVPANFVYWLAYSENSQDENNWFYSATTGSNHNLGVDATFRDLNDPRVRHRPDGRRGHNNSTVLYTPFQSPAFGDWTAAGENKGFERDTKIRLASGLEARYIRAEAEGPTPLTLALVNERRAVGNQAPVALTGDALMAELREQKRRDFFLNGNRLGDLRRWEARGIGNFFPTGRHPNPEWAADYGTSTCIPIADEEKIGNPNI